MGRGGVHVCHGLNLRGSEWDRVGRVGWGGVGWGGVGWGGAGWEGWFLRTGRVG